MSRRWRAGCCPAFLALATAYSVLGPAKTSAQSGAPKPAGLPPLQVDKDAPLLLDDPEPVKPPTQKSAAKSPAVPRLICHDCHGNFREESLAVAHAKASVACVDCHGTSDAHANDEGNTTPPGVMYPRSGIAPKCLECHKTHNASATKVIARWQERGLAKTSAQDLVCTDCHGEHRMKVRTIQWDRKTGQLLSGWKRSEK